MYEKTNQIHNRRPLSPHLTIYKPQISSVLSISHRMTGFALFVGAILFTWVLVAAVFCPEVTNCKFIKSKAMEMLIMAWSFALYYHLLNGIRHLFWDAGKGFEIKSMNASGIVVVLASIALTAISWLLVCTK